MYSADLMSSEAVIKRIKGALENPANRIEGSFASDNAQAVGKEIAKYYSHVQWLHEMHYVDTATGEFLEAKAREVGIYRKMGVWAKGWVEFTGQTGTVIPFDFVVRSETQEYRTLSEVVIGEDGTARVAVEARNMGIEGNVPRGAIKDFASLPGLQSVTNTEPITGGTESEPDDLLRERTLLRMRYPGTSGNQYHYMHWAMEVEGVGRVKVFPIWDGPGTVKVSVLDANQQKATQDLLNAVQEHIDPVPREGEGLAPIGAYLTVSTAEEVIVNISAEVVLSATAETTKEAVAEEYRKAVQEYFDEIAYTEIRRVTVAKLIDVLWNVAGVENILNFTINGAGENVSLGDEEIAKAGEVVMV